MKLKEDYKNYIDYMVSEILSDSFIVFIHGVQYVKFPFYNVPHKRSLLVAELKDNGNVHIFNWFFVSYITTKYACNSHYEVVYEKYMLRLVDEIDSLPIIR